MLLLGVRIRGWAWSVLGTGVVGRGWVSWGFCGIQHKMKLNDIDDRKGEKNQKKSRT